MKSRQTTIYKSKQVFFMTAWWLLINVFIELHNAVNYNSGNQKHFLYFIFGENAFQHFLITSIGPLIGGLLGGSFIVFYQREKLRGKTYAQKLFIHSMLYIFFVSFCILIVGLIGALNNKDSTSFLQSFYNDVFSLRVFRLLIDWYFVVVITIFLMDVSEKYGQGTLKKMLLGRYYKPVKEERIFMFLDMKSSTTIAEKIGEEKFFLMLHHFFQVANDAIINCFGEIYQYVGDEIVISWEKSKGLKNANCLRCFAEVKNIVQENSSYFISNFDVVPEFKAGAHFGMVAAGEIGSVKRDIVYSGDVLNTAARIVALCNQYNQQFLISQTLYEELKSTPGFRFSYLDSPELRGKSIQLGLYAVQPA